MELVKEKFIQTEIGILPSDWKTEKMGNLTTLMTNGFVGVAKIHYTDYENGVLYIQGYNVKENSFNFNGIKRVTEEFHKKNSKSYLLEGDLLTVQTGDVGLTTIVSKELEGSNCHALIISRFKRKKVNSKFISFYLNSNIGRIRLKEIETGTTMKHINVGDLIHFYVPLPPIQEQTAIANSLSDADNWINSLEELIAKKRLIKQGAMQELLKPKDGWEVKKLGEICDIIIGLTYSPNDVSDHGTLVLRSSNIQNNKLAFENNVFVKMDLPQRVIVKENDILVCVRNGSKQLIGKCALIDKKNSGHAFGAFMSIIRSQHNKYIYHYFLSNKIQIQIDENMGATINQLTNATLKSFEIYLPNNHEQTRIATVLSDMDAEITTLQVKLEKAKQIKLGMMQELLTGRIRLV